MDYKFHEMEYFLEHNLTRFKPWEIIFGERVNLKRQGLKERFPGTNLYPFAVRTDCDDVACFDCDNPKSVVILHDYSSVGWDQREMFDDFWAWLYRAVEDMIEFAKEDIEYEKNTAK